MDKGTWLNNLLTVAKSIASRDFQERAWFGHGPEISSPEEMYLTFFDDFMPALFYEKFSKEFTKHQSDSWHEFTARFEDYGYKMPDYPDPKKVLDDPSWQLVRESAAKFVAAFE